MYCTKCGQPVDDKAVMCVHCGYQFAQPQQKPDDKPSTAFAILGFFLPIVGLILLLVYYDKKPKTAKSAGKGALAGFITGIVISIILVILFVAIGFGIINHTVDNFDTYQENFEQFYEDHSQIFQAGDSSFSMNIFVEEEQWSPYIDITIGELEIIENQYYMETALDVTITNKHDERCSYYITIEAVDENNYRLSTDKVYVDSLNSGQSIVVEAFEYIDAESVEDYQNATFNVLEVSQTIIH